MARSGSAHRAEILHALFAAAFSHAAPPAPALPLRTFEIMEVRVLDDFEGALEAARTRHVEAGILLSSPLVFVYSKQISELALAKRKAEPHCDDRYA